MQEVIKKRVKELFDNNTIVRAIGWENGEFFYDHTPAVFDSAADMDVFVYDNFCASNLSKYLINHCAPEGKTLVLLKPCLLYTSHCYISNAGHNNDL